MASTAALAIYEQQILNLVRALPFSVGVKFHESEDEAYVMPYVRIEFTYLCADLKLSQDYVVHSGGPPPEYLVENIAARFIRDMLARNNN